ncbi:MAG: DUF3737 family protein [Clostridia bacterium]|nr:DUF3737 family protein [Clostridia bacterium]
MEKITDQKFTQERALFGRRDVYLNGCVFDEGESPLKEAAHVRAEQCLFRYKYPFWYCDGVELERVTFFEKARAGVWYTKHFCMRDAIVEAPKNFRRCEDITLSNVLIPDAAETLWSCTDVTLSNVSAKGDYFAMGCKNVRATDLDLIGNYSFDGVVNMEIKDSHLASKDSFWNSENVTVRNCFITGEYLGWNAKKLTFIDCTIESLQGMCYVDDLVMENCRLINTTLAFERSRVRADIRGGIKSVFNPESGLIRADRIEHLVIQDGVIDPKKTRIDCDEIVHTVDTPEGLW